MPLQVMCGEIDRENNPVGEPKPVASFDDRAAAQSFIEGEIARYDHNGFVPDGRQAGWWGRNDDDPFEKFHFWIEGDGATGNAGLSGEPGPGTPEPLQNPQYRGIP